MGKDKAKLPGELSVHFSILALAHRTLVQVLLGAGIILWGHLHLTGEMLRPRA